MPITFWIAFNAGILLLLVFDLAVLNRGQRVIAFKQALLMSAFWIGLAGASPSSFTSGWDRPRPWSS